MVSPEAVAYTAARSQSAVSSQAPATQSSADQISQQHRGRRRRTPLTTLSPTTSQTARPAVQQPNQPLNPRPPHHKVQPPPSRAHYDPVSNALPPLTRAALLKERRDFFDTRVTGRQEIWAAVKLVCELVEQDSFDDAQAVLDAAGCTCPSGDLWGRKGGVYDEFGEKYVVPAWLVGEPEGVVQEGQEEEEKSSSNDDEDEEDEEEVSHEKGKGKAILMGEPEGQKPTLRVRARLSNTAKDVIVRIRDEDKVRVIVRQIRDLANVGVPGRSGSISSRY
jgi:hypothetical protein